MHGSASAASPTAGRSPTTRGWTLCEFITTKRFNTWLDAYTYADRWTRQGGTQSDYTLARGGDK